MSRERSIAVNLRVSPAELEAIDRNVKAAGMTRTDFMVRAATQTANASHTRLSQALMQLDEGLISMKSELKRLQEIIDLAFVAPESPPAECAQPDGMQATEAPGSGQWT